MSDNTKTYAYQQTSKQDDSGRYALKDRPALNSNNVVQNFSKPDENKITSAQKPQNVEPLAGMLSYESQNKAQACFIRKHKL